MTAPEQAEESDRPSDTARSAAAAEDADDQNTIRQRVTRLAFDDDPDRYAEFVRAIDDATPAGVEVILRGSAVTGHKWHSDDPFDADGRARAISTSPSSAATW